MMALICKVARSAANRGPGGWVRASMSDLVFVAVGIVRFVKSWEETATNDSV